MFRANEQKLGAKPLNVTTAIPIQTFLFVTQIKILSNHEIEDGLTSKG